jgi:predicted DCC family thiol-disulfide oxidoreductase YuxK
MTSGWTGGQYSIYRALLAITIACVIEERLIPWLASGAAALFLFGVVLACTALAIGWQDRIAALLLWLVGMNTAAVIDGVPEALAGPDVVLGSILLLFHAATPRDPFGAWSARERPDPAGDWRMPDWIRHAAWVLLALVYLTLDLESISSAPAIRIREIGAAQMAVFGLLFDVTFAIAVFRQRWRASAWIAMSLWRLAEGFAFGGAINVAPLWLLHLLAADPAWFPGRSVSTSFEPVPGAPAVGDSVRPRPARLFYDGDCGMCHRSVRFILAEERATPEALRLRFAPIGSPAYDEMLEAHAEIDPRELPDSIVVELEDGRLLTRSSAALEIANRLGGFWRLLAGVIDLGGLMPRSLLDIAYDGIARVRKRIFARPKESCPILPAALRARFDF